MATDDDNALAERVTNLEIKVAYQEQLIASLDDVVREFADRVERLEKTIRELQAGEEAEVGPALEKPPHY